MEINSLGRLKMLLQRPYISKHSGGACLGVLDSAPPPPTTNKSNLATALQLHEHVHVPIRRGN